ncbi:HAD family hydrolase [Microvirga brassicacearum]|uniref:HAD family phosphatase n=1 Tax=Microvirga brassicacearum TaxID=2580413 RepID=A0A5N3P8D7_9HYPH|nr:HAD family phosphatase [Microvirga brassicacearum]KAB0266003.1 HAD family phosphatase [Microvirga brassicacearum]
MTLKALIFDMDGTLVHSDPVHLRAFAEVLGPEGVSIDDEVYRNTIIGRTNESIFATLLPGRPVTDHETFADLKEAAFRRLASDLKPLEGLLDLLDWADRYTVKIALVTNAPSLNASHMLDTMGLTDRFTVKITRDDVSRGKPDPLPYLTALDRLGLAADQAIAFEDSPSGMKAAKGAGLFSFGILTGLTAADMTRAGADITIPNFQSKALWDVLAKRLGTAT